MSSPNVSLVIEPSEGNSVIYQTLARETVNSQHRIKIGLVIEITNNNDTIDIVLTRVKIIFKNSPSDQGLVFQFSSDLTIPKSGTAAWVTQGGFVGSGGNT